MSKKKLLDDIIDNAPDGQIPQVQLMLGGQLLQGALAHSPDYEGLYLLESAIQVQGQMGLSLWTFGAEDVTALMLFRPQEESRIAQPPGKKSSGGLIIQ